MIEEELIDDHSKRVIATVQFNPNFTTIGLRNFLMEALKDAFDEWKHGGK